MPLTQTVSFPRRLQPNTHFPQTITTEEELDEAVLSRLQELGATGGEEAAKVAFAIIHHSRLTPKVYQELRRNHFPSLLIVTIDRG